MNQGREFKPGGGVWSSEEGEGIWGRALQKGPSAGFEGWVVFVCRRDDEGFLGRGDSMHEDWEA